MITKLYPSAAEMDLDMWRAASKRHTGGPRDIVDKNDVVIVTIHGVDKQDAARDTLARRVEMIGDLYEELRMLAERAQEAGLDVSQAKQVLGDFVAPKPFPPKGGV